MRIYVMEFISLEDREGLVEAVLFEKAYKQFWHLFRGYDPYVVKGRVQSRLLPTSRDLHFVPTGEANLLVDEVEVLQVQKENLETNNPKFYGLLLK